MKDIDFEELDKAVNSLIKKTESVDAESKPKKHEKSGKSEKSVKVNVSSPAKENESSTTSETNESTERDTETSSKPSPVVKRSGKFMDVVHPSSDMRAKKPILTSREGKEITPPTSVIEDVKKETVEEPVVSTPQPSESDVNVETPKPSTETTWPDPIDVHIKNSSVAETPQVEKSEDVPEPVQTNDESEDMATSPFLPDTKVEKRPLGGAGPEQEASSVPREDAEPAEPFMGQEDSTNHEEALLPAKVEDETPAEGEVTLSPEPTKESPVAPSGPISITKQYKEQPSSSDQHHEAIYDQHDAAHLAKLAHPPKKTSGWLVVVAVILLIIIGAGLAAALHFLGII